MRVSAFSVALSITLGLCHANAQDAKPRIRAWLRLTST